MEDGIQIAHQHKRYLHLILDGLQLGKEFLEAHAVLQGLCGSTLYDGAVGQGIAKGNAHLDHGDTTSL